MSISNPPSDLVSRAKAILLTPAAAWPAIAAEPASVGGLYTGYIAILAAIPPLANFLHGVLFGYGAFGFSYHPGFFGALTTAIVTYIFTLGGTFLVSFIIAALAPTFQGQNNQLQALKLIAYASTASWLAGIFQLIPGLGILGLLGLYSLYLFYIGLPVLMQSPPEKSLPYTLVIFVAVIVIGVVVSFAGNLVTGGSPYGRLAGGGGSISFPSDNGDSTGGSRTITTPGGGTVQLDKLAQLGAAFAAIGKTAEAGTSQSGTNTGNTGSAPGSTITATPVATLKALLPSELPGGMARTESSSAGGQIAGVGGSTAQATFAAANGRQITLTVADLGAMGALAGAAGVLGISGDSETPTSYSHVMQQGGRTIAEEYDRTARHGTFSVIIASRFMIHAEGNNLSMDDLHQAVSTIDASRLEALAR